MANGGARPSGVYWVWVTNFFSAQASSNATLTVFNPAQIITQPANAGVLLGSNVSFTVTASGTAVGYQWYFDWTPLTDNGHVTGSATPTLSITNVENSDGGDYQVLISNLLSSVTSRRATLTPLTNSGPSIRYVNESNSTPASPYLTWSTAATDIQTAVNASLAGDQIVVTDGVYQSGGYLAPDGALTCVVNTNAVTLQSVNGENATSINGSNAMR
ncbi:MAG TPA: immunoglobulin domain-containing protein [Candidatus Saccharimonadales bacterium]|nr:immunoglobulin domain-containing protein [Candidatus Saccharimonadales bacterium]